MIGQQHGKGIAIVEMLGGRDPRLQFAALLRQIVADLRGGGGGERPDGLILVGQGHDDQGGQSRLEGDHRSEEHTSELQSLMRTSYAVFCLNKTHTLFVQCAAMRNTTNTSAIPSLIPQPYTTLT